MRSEEEIRTKLSELETQPGVSKWKLDHRVEALRWALGEDVDIDDVQGEPA